MFLSGPAIFSNELLLTVPVFQFVLDESQDRRLVSQSAIYDVLSRIGRDNQEGQTGPVSAAAGDSVGISAAAESRPIQSIFAGHRLLHDWTHLVVVQPSESS
jgi:hypothetical protein